MFLYALVQSGEYDHEIHEMYAVTIVTTIFLVICPAQSPNNNLTEMRVRFSLCFYSAFRILLHKIVKFVVTSDPLESR